MDGPPETSINKTILPLPPTHVLDKLMEMHCVKWHPKFQSRNYQLFMDIINNDIPYEDLNNDNKWGYQYHISKGIEKDFTVDFTDRISVKNMIVADNFICSRSESKFYYYSNIGRSVYEIFHKYMNKYSKDIDDWYCDEMKGIRELHKKFKKKYSQYSYFETDEEGLDCITDAVIKLATS